MMQHGTVIGRTLVVVCLAATLAAACGTAPAVDGAKKTTHTTGSNTASSASPAIVTTPSGAEVLFPKQSAPGRAGGLALASGKLVLDEGCLRLRWRSGSEAPLWPPGFELEVSGGEIRVLNGRGRVVARPDEWVRMGGNPLDGPLKASYVVGGERTVRKLRERCPGASYWVATPDRMRVIQQPWADTYLIRLSAQ